MTNAYCDLAAVKSAGALNIAGTAYDGRLLALLEGASRQIDAYCNRRFYIRQAAVQFEVSRWSAELQQLLVPDLAAVDSVKVARGSAGPEGNPVWATASYRLFPLDAAPARPWGRPYTRVAIESSGGLCNGELRRRASAVRVEISGRWGYREVVADTGAVIGANDLDAESATLEVSDGASFAPGQTLAVDAEQLYVTAVAENQLTAERGVNGTAATAHSAGANIRIYRYPGPVSEACLQLAVRLWHSRDRAAAAVGGGRQIQNSGKRAGPGNRGAAGSLPQTGSLVGG